MTEGLPGSGPGDRESRGRGLQAQQAKDSVEARWGSLPCPLPWGWGSYQEEMAPFGVKC